MSSGWFSCSARWRVSCGGDPPVWPAITLLGAEVAGANAGLFDLCGVHSVHVLGHLGQGHSLPRGELDAAFALDYGVLAPDGRRALRLF